MNDEPAGVEPTAIEQRLRFADEREEALDERECEIAARKSQRTWLADDVESVFTKAARRDAQASSKDSAAGKRDMAANMHAWLSGDEGRADAEARQEALDPSVVRRVLPSSSGPPGPAGCGGSHRVSHRRRR